MDDCNTIAMASAFCSQLRSFCAHLGATCSTLRSSVDQRPASLPPPPGAELPSFFENLSDRVSSTSRAVEALKAMTTDTISFEELLGHCMELYRQNEGCISTLEDHLKQYGYKPDESLHCTPQESISPMALNNVKNRSSAFQLTDLAAPSISGGGIALEKSMTAYEDNLSGSHRLSSPTETSELASLGVVPVHPIPDTATTLLRDDALSLSLQDLGLSAAGLACLAREDSLSPSPSIEIQYSGHSAPAKQIASKEANLGIGLSNHQDMSEETITVMPSSTIDKLSSLGESSIISENVVGKTEATQLKKVDEVEYNKTPSFLRMLVSLEDLNNFVGSINEIFMAKRRKGGAEVGTAFLHQEDLKSLGAESRAKACLLVLVRVGRLATQHQNGAATYRPVLPE